MNPVNGAAKPLYKIARRFYSKSCGLIHLFPIIAGPDSLRESRLLSGNPHEEWCEEGELEAPPYPIIDNIFWGVKPRFYRLFCL